jgi:hypothetical protein
VFYDTSKNALDSFDRLIVSLVDLGVQFAKNKPFVDGFQFCKARRTTLWLPDWMVQLGQCPRLLPLNCWDPGGGPSSILTAFDLSA